MQGRERGKRKVTREVKKRREEIRGRGKKKGKRREGVRKQSGNWDEMKRKESERERREETRDGTR